MEKVSLILCILLLANSAMAGPVSFVSDYFNKKKYVYENEGSSDFQACLKFNSEEESDYYVTCERNLMLESADVEQLSKDASAIEKEVLREDFLRELGKNVKEKMDARVREVDALLACVPNGSCPDKANALVTGLKGQLPRLRALMAQKDMPGTIYSATRPIRYQAELKHQVTGVEIKPLDEREKEFLKSFTWEMEDQFEEQVRRERPDIADKPVIVSTFANKKFEEQNKQYQKMYGELVSSNPLLSLVSLRGNESDSEIIKESLEGLGKIKDSLLKARSKVDELEEDDRSGLVLYQTSVEELLASKDSRIYCAVAGEVRDEQDFEEFKEDLILGSAMLAGGGACALTFGVGCALGVAVVGEAVAIKMSRDRKENEMSLFYSAQSSVEDVKRRSFEHDLTVYLAPLSFVGEGFGKLAVKSANRFGHSAGTGRRFDLEQRKAINTLDSSLGAKKADYLNEFNFGNKFNLSHGDEIYLSGIISELKKQKLPDGKIREYVEELVRQCKGGK